MEESVGFRGVVPRLPLLPPLLLLLWIEVPPNRWRKAVNDEATEFHTACPRGIAAVGVVVVVVVEGRLKDDSNPVRVASAVARETGSSSGGCGCCCSCGCCWPESSAVVTGEGMEDKGGSVMVQFCWFVLVGGCLVGSFLLTTFFSSRVFHFIVMTCHFHSIIMACWNTVQYIPHVPVP